MKNVPDTLEISLNGQRMQSDAQTLHALLLAQGFEIKAAMACAINKRFVPRNEWPSRALQPGDQIDVVSPITGG